MSTIIGSGRLPLDRRLEAAGIFTTLLMAGSLPLVAERPLWLHDEAGSEIFSEPEALSQNVNDNGLLRCCGLITVAARPLPHR